jgi:PLP dependent protein
MHSLSANLAALRARIAVACGRAGRHPSEVTLVAVTKTVPPRVISELLQLGVRDIGENRQQDAAERLPRVAGIAAARLHFIGPLQRNKVRRVLEQFQVIHSVDSPRLAAEISRRAVELGRTMDIFLEVNIAADPGKHGLAPEGAAAAARESAALPGLNVLGLMCMAPYDEEAEHARAHFRALAVLSRALLAQGAMPQSATALSMGMSGDFEIAIEEGATHIRVGTSLFAGVH